MQLYTGMRTKHCRLIARVTCVEVTLVRLRFDRTHGPMTFTYGDVILGVDAMERFAQEDGFGLDGGIAMLDMATFWFANHGRESDEIDFKGVLIRWGAIEPAAEERAA